MRFFYRISNLWRNLIHRNRVDDDLSTEIRAYQEMLTERLLREGADPASARRQALIEFGGTEQIMERVREVRMSHYLETLAQDVRYGVRVLLRNRIFTVVAVITLALGIGANTAIFSVVNALLLRPLPYASPDRLVAVGEVTQHRKEDRVPGPHLLEWIAQNKTLERIAAYSPDEFTMTGGEASEKLRGIRVSANFFSTLGAQPLLGRDFLPADDQPRAEGVAIISHGLWERRFSSDKTVVGRTVVLDDARYTLVGVLPAEFRFSVPSDIWVPMALDPKEQYGNQMISNVFVIGRLGPKATREQTQSELETIRSRFESRRGADQIHFGGITHVTSLHDRLIGDTRQLLIVLPGAVSLILLIACANVANLLLSRGAARQKEFAIRASLGGDRLRLVQQMLTESFTLAFIGGISGLILAFGMTKALVILASTDAFGQISRLSTIDIDFRVLGFGLLISCITGMLFGLGPAFQLSRPDLADCLKEGGRGGLSHRGRLRNLLMVSEVTLSVILLVGAGLLVRSFVNLMEVNPGYRSDSRLTMRVSLSDQRYQQRSQREAFYREALQRISTLPGVESVGAINHLPLNDFQILGWLRVPGRPQLPNSQQTPTPIGIVSTDYFRTVAIPLRSGRLFTERDNSESPRVLILSESLARALFPNEDPIGKQLWTPGPPTKDLPTVIGVVGDIRHEGLDKQVTPQVYAPFQQFAQSSMMLVVHTSGDPLSLASAARSQILSLDKEAPVYEVETMDSRMSNSVAPRRFNLLLLGSLAFLALSLSAVGVYGVIAYAASQRTQEIGIRMALGARGGDVLRMLIGQGMVKIAAGVVLGLTGAWALTRIMKSLLFGVSATDPLTFAGVAVVLTVVALLACYIPARRAARVDPMQALRYE